MNPRILIAILLLLLNSLCFYSILFSNYLGLIGRLNINVFQRYFLDDFDEIAILSQFQISIILICLITITQTMIQFANYCLKFLKEAGYSLYLMRFILTYLEYFHLLKVFLLMVSKILLIFVVCVAFYLLFCLHLNVLVIFVSRAMIWVGSF